MQRALVGGMDCASEFLGMTKRAERRILPLVYLNLSDSELDPVRAGTLNPNLLFVSRHNDLVIRRARARRFRRCPKQA